MLTRRLEHSSDAVIYDPRQQCGNDEERALLGLGCQVGFLSLESLTERCVLKQMEDGPTLQQLTQKISLGLSKEVSSKSVGDLLLVLQRKGCVFLEDGRWWRTPEGVAHLEQLMVEKASEHEKRERPSLSKLSMTHSGGTSKSLILVAIAALAVLAFKLSFAYAYALPGWDSATYLLNARRFLYGYSQFSFFELLRPPLLPFVISLVWLVFGESYPIVVPIQPIFTVLAALVLYVIMREMFDWKTAILSFFIFLFSPPVFVWSNELLTHGVQLLFALLSVFFAWRTHGESSAANQLQVFIYAILVGFFAALSSLARYPAIVFFPAVLIIALRRDVAWDAKWIMVCGLSFLVTWIPWLGWNMVNVGGDPFGSVRAAFFSQAYTPVELYARPWYFYLAGLVDLVSIGGVCLLLVGIIDKRAFKDPKILMFICWFLIATVIHTLLPNKDLRFALDWFPSVSALVALGARRIQRPLGFRPRVVFGVLLSLWLIYLAWSSNIAATAELKTLNNPPAMEVQTVATWVTANMATNQFGASDSFAPQFAFFTKRYFYSLDYLQSEAATQGTTLRELMVKRNVTRLILKSEVNPAGLFDRTDQLVMLKRFDNFVVYAVSGGIVSKPASAYTKLIVVLSDSLFF